MTREEAERLTREEAIEKLLDVDRRNRQVAQALRIDMGNGELHITAAIRKLEGDKP